MKKFIPLAGFLLLLPAVANAQTLGTVLTTVGNLIDALIPIVVGIAVLIFFWGLAQYILKTGDEEGRAQARNLMIWGIIALFVIISVWGLVRLLQDTFNIQRIDSINPPSVQGL